MGGASRFAQLLKRLLLKVGRMQGSGHHGRYFAMKPDLCVTLIDLPEDSTLIYQSLPPDAPRPSRKDYLLCDRHSALCQIFFELVHMESDFQKNAEYQILRFYRDDEMKDLTTPKEKIERIPAEVYKAQIAGAMGRYHRLLIFGTSSELSEWGVQPYYEQTLRLVQEIPTYRRSCKRETRK